MHVFVLLLVLVISASVLGVIEFVKHQKRIYSIPIRIHVNGTRGKSSVARLIGAALNEGGIKTITKVTGTHPRLILDDGKEFEIHRKSNANIIEQLDIVKFAVKKNAEALVIECMALDPQYQTITETKMIHATIGVITNVRLDHVDIMGYTLPEIASVLGRTIPKNQFFFTAENQIPEVLQKITYQKNSKAHFSDPSGISDDEMNSFSYIEHKENVALAIDICNHLGIERETALRGMYKAISDSGALNKYTVDLHDKKINFYNGFAANDPQSTLMIWRKLLNDNELKGSRFILLNTRQDRLDRAKQLAEMVGKETSDEADFLVLIGQSTDVVENMSIHFGFEKNKIINLGWTDAQNVFNNILDNTTDISTVVAIGNIGGMGNSVVEYFSNQTVSKKLESINYG